MKSIPALKSKLKKPVDHFVFSALPGSFPELDVHRGIDANIWYASYIQTYLERDVPSIHDIGNLRKFYRLMQILAGNCANILTLSSLAKEIGVSNNTIKRWISILEGTNLIFFELFPLRSK